MTYLFWNPSTFFYTWYGRAWIPPKLDINPPLVSESPEDVDPYPMHELWQRHRRQVDIL